jgi:hypothetical protein
VAGFEDLITTDVERDALARLRAATGVVAGPMERHCLRCRHTLRRASELTDDVASAIESVA